MMKLLLPVLGCTMLLLSSNRCPADLVCYQGLGQITTIGSGVTTRSDFGLFLVVNRDNGHIGQVTFVSRNGRKTYSVSASADYHIVQYIGMNQITNTAITHLPTDCETNNSIATEEKIYAAGANAKLPVGTNTVISFPRILTSSSRTVTHISSGPLDYYVSDWSTAGFAFDKKRTQAVNSVGGSIDDAIVAFTNFLQTLGYTLGP